MLTVREMLSLAENKRDKAERARRWSGVLVTPEDQGRLLVFAQELEDEAEELERQACRLTSEVAASVLQRHLQPPSA